MDRKDAIRSAYRMTGSNNFYDGMMTCSTLPGRLVCRLVWAMNRADCEEYQDAAMAGIPENSFREVRRVLRRGGVFMICNECGGDGRGENWEKVVSGMNVYGGEALRGMLERAGFSGVWLHTNSRGWLCVTAKNE